MTIHFPRRRKAQGEHPAFTGDDITVALAALGHPPAATMDEAPAVALDRLKTEELHRLAADGRPSGALAGVPQFQGREAPRAGFAPGAPLPSWWPRPAPVPSFTPKAALRATAALRLPQGRPAEFAADFRALPLFQDVARSLGWCGLHQHQAPAGHRRYTFAAWERRAMDAIEAQWWQARSDADEQLGRAEAEVAMELDGYLRAAAGTRAA